MIGNTDPQGRARLQVEVPDVLGADPVWALPCLPDPDLARFTPPRPGTRVWIEFEQGDVHSPIWTGFF